MNEENEQESARRPLPSTETGEREECCTCPNPIVNVRSYGKRCHACGKSISTKPESEVTSCAPKNETELQPNTEIANTPSPDATAIPVRASNGPADVPTGGEGQKHERCPACNSPMAIVCNPTGDKEYWECFNCFYGKHPVPPTPPDAREAAAREMFRPDEVQSAIEQWLAFGEASKGTAHHGYFSDSGWAARALRYIARHLPDAEQLRREVHENRMLLNGCAKHGKWNGFACIGCLEEENKALTAAQQAAREDGELLEWWAKYGKTITRNSPDLWSCTFFAVDDEPQYFSRAMGRTVKECIRNAITERFTIRAAREGQAKSPLDSPDKP
jgi:hypothetical protein